uniref:Uncharacterized protein n=1 Tax=Mycena chlorophos TaxID=658473 RepID=A0ABQ0LB62_MYCCL|nr:predicted protein [Mycena chlorophos]
MQPPRLLRTPQPADTLLLRPPDEPHSTAQPSYASFGRRAGGRVRCIAGLVCAGLWSSPAGAYGHDGTSSFSFLLSFQRDPTRSLIRSERRSPRRCLFRAYPLCLGTGLWVPLAGTRMIRIRRSSACPPSRTTSITSLARSPAHPWDPDASKADGCGAKNLLSQDSRKHTSVGGRVSACPRGEDFNIVATGLCTPLLLYPHSWRSCPLANAYLGAGYTRGGCLRAFDESTSSGGCSEQRAVQLQHLRRYTRTIPIPFPFSRLRILVTSPFTSPPASFSPLLQVLASSYPQTAIFCTIPPSSFTHPSLAPWSLSPPPFA